MARELWQCRCEVSLWKIGAPCKFVARGKLKQRPRQIWKCKIYNFVCGASFGTTVAKYKVAAFTRSSWKDKHNPMGPWNIYLLSSSNKSSLLWKKHNWILSITKMNRRKHQIFISSDMSYYSDRRFTNNTGQFSNFTDFILHEVFMLYGDFME